MVAKKHSYLTEQFLSIRAPNISFPYTFEAPTFIPLGSTNYFCQSALTASNAADHLSFHSAMISSKLISTLPNAASTILT